MSLEESYDELKKGPFMNDYNKELLSFKKRPLQYKVRDLSENVDVLIKVSFSKEDIAFHWSTKFQNENNGFIEIPCFYPRVFQLGEKSNKLLDYEVKSLGHGTWEVVQKKGYRTLNPTDAYYEKDFIQNKSFYLHLDDENDVFKLIKKDQLPKSQKERNDKLSERHIGLLNYYFTSVLYLNIFDGPNVKIERFTAEKQIILNFLSINYYLLGNFTDTEFVFLTKQVNKIDSISNVRDKQLRLNLLFGRSFYLTEEDDHSRIIPSIGEYMQSSQPGEKTIRTPKLKRIFYDYVLKTLIKKKNENSSSKLIYLSNNIQLHTLFNYSLNSFENG